MAVGAIAPLIGHLLLALDAQRPLELAQPVEVFYHRARLHAAGGPVRQQLLPLDAAWWRAAAATPWPTPARPELLGSVDATLAGCIRQFLFVSLFRACADSQQANTPAGWRQWKGREKISRTCRAIWAGDTSACAGTASVKNCSI